MPYHIHPKNDIREHCLESDKCVCECNPKVITEDGEIIYIHNSFDNRELLEDLLDEINGKP